MADFGTFGDVHVELGDDFVATAEIRRPPNNFFDFELISSLADAFTQLDESAACRAIVLAAEGKNFCAGANFGGGGDKDTKPGDLYQEATRLFGTDTPVVAAIQGAAIGGGLGLALMPDFRIASPEARFAANFARLGFHHGFGLTVTLPDLVGKQKALELLYTGRRVKGDEALELGLADRLVPAAELRDAAHAFAREIAISSPLAVVSIRKTMRGDMAAKIQAATDHELEEQAWLRATADFKEGVKAMSERRDPNFAGE